MEVVAQKKLKVAINGFGRIGRNFLRCWEGRKDSLLEVVAINDSGGVKQASHLLKYDSILGTFNADVKVVSDDTISVNGKQIKIVSSRDPLTLPWKALGIDLVIEGTGVFIDVKGAGKHIEVRSRDDDVVLTLHFPDYLSCNNLMKNILLISWKISTAGRSQEGSDHCPRQGQGDPHLRRRSQRAGLQARVPHHLQRLLHHQLPCPLCQGEKTDWNCRVMESYGVPTTVKR